MSELHPKIMAAKVEAVLDPNLCFFGSLIVNLKYVEDTTCETMWTDGTSLGYNPKFVDTLTHAEVIGCLAHEAMHCSNGHPWRRDGRDMQKWNIAADKAINPVLTDVGIALPKGALTATAEEHGKSTEWIFDRLPDMPKGGGCGFGEVRDSPSGSGDDSQDADSDTHVMSEGEWKELTRRAAVEAKMRGKLPASLDRYSKMNAKPRIDPKDALRKFVQRTSKDDYSWSVPNRRFMGHDFYMPGLKSEDMPKVAIGVDTSGSIDEVALAQAKAITQAVMEESRPKSVDILYADAEVAGMDSFERDEPLVFRPRGGGGTDFRPVFDKIAAMEEPPACIIYITDLYGTFPSEEPEIPTIWITDSDIEAPFGETLHLD